MNYNPRKTSCTLNEYLSTELKIYDIRINDMRHVIENKGRMFVKKGFSNIKLA